MPKTRFSVLTSFDTFWGPFKILCIYSNFGTLTLFTIIPYNYAVQIVPCRKNKDICFFLYILLWNCKVGLLQLNQFLNFRTSEDKTLMIFSDFKISEKELFLIKFDIVKLRARDFEKFLDLMHEKQYYKKFPTFFTKSQKLTSFGNRYLGCTFYEEKIYTVFEISIKYRFFILSTLQWNSTQMKYTPVRSNYTIYLSRAQVYSRMHFDAYVQ